MLQICSTENPEVFLNFFDFLVTFVLLRVLCVHSKVFKLFLQKQLPLRSRLPEQKLQEMGVAPGTPRYQKILDAHFYAVLEGKARTRTEQKKFLKSLVQKGK